MRKGRSWDLIQKQLTTDFVVKERKTVSNQLTGKLYTKIQRNARTSVVVSSKEQGKTMGKYFPLTKLQLSLLPSSWCLLDMTFGFWNISNIHLLSQALMGARKMKSAWDPVLSVTRIRGQYQALQLRLERQNFVLKLSSKWIKSWLSLEFWARRTTVLTFINLTQLCSVLHFCLYFLFSSVFASLVAKNMSWFYNLHYMSCRLCVNSAVPWGNLPFSDSNLSTFKWSDAIDAQ